MRHIRRNRFVTSQLDSGICQTEHRATNVEEGVNKTDILPLAPTDLSIPRDIFYGDEIGIAVSYLAVYVSLRIYISLMDFIYICF